MFYKHAGVFGVLVYHLAGKCEHSLAVVFLKE